MAIQMHKLTLSVVAGLAVLLSACPGTGPGPGPNDAGAVDAGTACERLPALTEAECAALFSSVLPETLPPSPGNAVADEIGAAYLGFAMFYDARFSGNFEVRCASCHLPELFFDDHEAQPEGGLGHVSRNTPTILNSAWVNTQFWDGRADSLWSQPLFALEAEVEMGISRLAIAHRMQRSYKSSYEDVFGPLPDLDDDARFPPEGGPGDAAFDGMSDDDIDAINRVFTNVGKSFDAYMRKLAAGRARFDEFALGDDDALSDEEQRGAEVFVQVGCIECHSGPLLSDNRYHNLGLGPWPGDAPDEGRAVGAAVLADSLFSLRGPYADDHALTPPTREALLEEASAPEALGAIRTPSLRNLTLSPPYGHNGRWATLEDAIAHHLAPPDGEGYVGTLSPLLSPQTLSDEELASLVAFLGALDGAYPPEPWSSWPDR